MYTQRWAGTSDLIPSCIMVGHWEEGALPHIVKYVNEIGTSVYVNEIGTSVCVNEIGTSVCVKLSVVCV